VRGLIAIIAIAVAIGSPAWSDLSIEEIIGNIEKRESGIKDVSLKFRNEMRLRATGDKQIITGDIAMLKEPQRFRVHYRSPVEQVAFYDGSALLIYFPATGQAVRQKASMMELTRMIGINPVAPTKFLKEENQAKLVDCGKKSCILEVRRETGKESEEGSEVEERARTWRIKVSIDTWLVEEASMKDDEFEISISCQQYRINEGIEAKDLAIRLPEGTEIIEGMPQLFRSMQPDQGQ
jgi:outer membrane lipoprotein-sorting protein